MADGSQTPIMNQKLKYRLPVYSELPHLSLTQDELSQWQKLATQHDLDFVTALEANGELCRFHPELTTSTYQNMLQINLTDSVYENRSFEIETFPQESLVGSHRKKMAIAMDTSSVLSEHSFTKPSSTYIKHQDFIEKTLNKFKDSVTRLRLVKLEPGKSITPHIDYDPSYAVRVIIPLISPQDCLNIFWVKGDTQVVNFREGGAYFLNTGFRHAVVNLSKKSRVTLMITVNGTADVEELLVG